jgi:hypothetical protein
MPLEVDDSIVAPGAEPLHARFRRCVGYFVARVVTSSPNDLESVGDFLVTVTPSVMAGGHGGPRGAGNLGWERLRLGDWCRRTGSCPSSHRLGQFLFGIVGDVEDVEDARVVDEGDVAGGLVQVNLGHAVEASGVGHEVLASVGPTALVVKTDELVARFVCHGYR